MKLAVFLRQMNPVVSVVVPTCGRPDLLRRCVAALEAQTVPPDEVEITVVDDTHSRHGPANARNRCWLERGLAAFGPELGPRVDAVCGRLVMPIPATPTDYERNESGLERAEFVTANCFVRKEILQRIGGFDESFRLPWREDSDLHFRLLEAGCTIVRADDAVVVHPVRPAPWGVSVKQQ